MSVFILIWYVDQCRITDNLVHYVMDKHAIKFKNQLYTKQ